MILVYFCMAITLATLVPAQSARTVQEFVRDSRSEEGVRVRRSSVTPEEKEDIISYVEDLLTGKVEEQEEKVDHRQCGRVEIPPTPLVTHGNRAEKGKWPWHIALYRFSGASHNYTCGGSLIGRRTVITAAHCVKDGYSGTIDPETLVVYLGKHHLKFWSGVQEKQVTDIWVHPEYSSTTLYADIAILTLSSPADYTSIVRPVCLWDKNEVKETGEPGTVVGWGRDEKERITGELMTAKMPIVTDLVCIKSYSQFYTQFVNDNNFCAGFKNGTSVCNGDSGGGMVFPILHDGDSRETWYIRGIVSISPGRKDSTSCDPNHYVVFTDVSQYLDWIKKYLR